ncbi:hypothetical protein [Pelagibacterium halotolerans]|uniref:hypothetical protein n=1 Tax=Pelagibacterium halotolerans TaxID=531813 RepID=UPI00384BEF0F
MKLTWFAGMTFRLHIGGEIVVTDPDGAPEAVDAAELTSGAGRVVHRRDAGIAAFDPVSWRPRRPKRMIDAAAGTARPEVFRLEGGFAFEAPEEGLVVLLDCDVTADAGWDRWADNAVVILEGTAQAASAAGMTLLKGARPRLIALGVADAVADAAFDALAPRLDGAGLIVLEPGLAVEI